MCAKWLEKSNHSIDIFIKKIDDLKKSFDSGKFKGFYYYELVNYLTAIESFLILNKEISETKKFLILKNAVETLLAKKQLSAKAILGLVSKEENLYLKKPKFKYVVVTSISLHFFHQLKNKKINGTYISFSRFLPKKYNQSEAIKGWKELGFGNVPADYTAVKISVKARTPDEAYIKAIDALDLLRGIWNLSLIGEEIFGWNTGILPINKVTLGPFHTVHFQNGRLTTDDSFWYELDFVKNTQQYVISNLTKLTKAEKFFRKCLSKHAYRSDLEEILKSYARALDYRDLHTSFVELWIILEKLTATTNANYEKMINKVTFTFKDVDLHKQFLQHLRIYRNANIHEGRKSERIKKKVFQLKGYVDNMLRFHIVNYFKFKSLEEAAAFLDLNPDLETLKKRNALLKKAIKYRS